MTEEDLQHGAEAVSDEYQDEHEDDAAEGAASLIGMRIRRRSRRGGGQGFANQARPQSAASPGLAAPARMARPQSEPTPPPPPPAARPQPQAQQPAPAPVADSAPKRPQDIVHYWDQLRQGRRFPARDDLDAAEIARHWPNSMLVRHNRETKKWQLEKQFSGGLQGGSNGQTLSKGPGAECASMVTEWILSLCHDVAGLGKPLQDTEVFPTSLGEVRYNVIALPLSENQNDIDHVLYHLAPANRAS